MNHSTQNDLRLIEAGFPCHQVGAETQPAAFILHQRGSGF
jgi:hypothetical protein